MKFPIFICLCLLLGGCSEKSELTFMTGGAAHELVFWEQALKDFEKESGIPVHLVRSASQTEQRKQQITVGLRGGKPDPDVFAMDIAWIGQLASSGWLENLDTYKIDVSPFFKNIISAADRQEGKLVGLPLWSSVGLLYYRKDLLQKYGYSAPPETWSELTEMALKVQKGERKNDSNFWGYLWQGAQYEGLVCNALELMSSAGGAFFDDQGQPVLNSPENIKALTALTAFIQEQSISPPNTFTDMKEEEVRMSFQNGHALFERNWPYAMKLHEEPDSQVKGKFAVAVLPHFEGHSSAATLGGWHVGMSKTSDQKENAVKLIRFLSSYGFQKSLAVQLGHHPGRSDVYDDAELKNHPVSSLKPMMKIAVSRPSLPYYSQVSLILQKHFNAALSGRSTPQDALEQAQRETIAIIKDFKLSTP